MYTTRDVANKLGCSTATVDRLITRGVLQAVNISPGTKLASWRVSTTALDEFLKTRVSTRVKAPTLAGESTA